MVPTASNPPTFTESIVILQNSSRKREDKKREGRAGAAGLLFLGMDRGERRKKKKHGKRLEAADTTINPTVLEIISSKIT